MNEQKPLVLIVDDNTTNIDLLVSTLSNDYRLGIAKSGIKALDYAEKNKPDLILLDVMMPGMNGYDVCYRLKNSPNTQSIAVIFITAMRDTDNITKGFKLGAVDYITKPFYAAEVKSRVSSHLALKLMREELNSQNIILEEKVKEKTLEIQKMLEETIKAMSLAGESRDPYTAGHQQRVSKFAESIAKKMELPEDIIEHVKIAGILHDIGKIRIPMSILNRPGKLLNVEFEFVKIHSQVSYDILKSIPCPWPLAEIVLQHHERLDGSGYPRGLKGEEILLESKILCAVDVIEAMSSHRPYRPALGIDIALQEIEKNKGRIYDPDVADACLAYFDRTKQE
ncbi:MAG: response regulator [Desulfobacterales bacterium]|nr:response regulator [Desulfobacterales bacterium]